MMHTHAHAAHKRSVDGLTPLMEAEAARQQARAAEAAGGKPAAAAGQSPGQSPGEAAEGGGGKGGCKDWLGYTVALLAGLPAESLERLQAAPRAVAVYRCGHCFKQECTCAAGSCLACDPHPARKLERVTAYVTHTISNCRAVRSQRFLECTEQDLRAREAKALETWRMLTAKRGKVRDCAFV